MDLQLQNKVFIVTGGGSGIGGGISLALAREGAVPAIFGRSDLKKDFTDELSAITSKSHFFKADLTNEELCKKGILEVIEKFGTIHGLVNCAGANDGVSLEAGVDAFRKSLENNLVHYYTMAHYALSELKKNKGSIVNVSSKTALTGQGNTSGYTAAKGAELSLTREWAATYLADGVRVNAVIPAEVWTPLYERWINTFPSPEEKLRTITKNIPLGRRMTTVEEIADMVVFLLSPRSSHTTGQWIVVDGGYTHLDRAVTA
ncbi:MAG: SDR family oxidoreductase [Deltaproteobacteria bacterium]|jgi:L-fucose dehydrogenase|nr:SDR family oxidoreductase [Deltaproteobacteria bacterium]